ncbi:hypothetical protein ACFLU9_02035 [Chloroflexota bacterium]
MTDNITVSNFTDLLVNDTWSREDRSGLKVRNGLIGPVFYFIFSPYLPRGGEEEGLRPS